jgi:transcriptional regulator GlxA family with amidase domain
MMQNEIDYLNQLLVTCPDDTAAIDLAIDLIEAEDYDALANAFATYQATTPCKTNIAACVDRVLLGAKA